MIDGSLGHSPTCLHDMLRFVGHVKGKMYNHSIHDFFVLNLNSLNLEPVSLILEL